MSLRYRIAAVAFLFLGLNGCVNLDDAAGLSTLSDQARVALPKVSNDIAGTCTRQKALIDNIPDNERPPEMQAQDCKSYEDVADRLAKYENVLADYFDALGKLASNKPLTYDANIDTNVSNASSNSALAASTVTAGNDAQNLLKAIADAVTRGYREKHLAQLIQQADPAVQSLTKSLKHVITADYGAVLLSNEEASLDFFYQGPLKAPHPNERLSLMLVQRQYGHDKIALQNRRAGIKDYGKVMDDMAALHAKLNQEAGKKASLVEVAKQIAPIVEALKTTLADIQSRSN